MLSTKDMSAGSGGTKPVIGTGNQKVKINSITFDQTPYDMDAYNITLHVESEPIVGEFNGFLKDVNEPNGPRYAGQVGRVRFSPYPFKDATLNNGNEISRDTEVLKAMVFLSEVVGKRNELDAIEANTIEDFMIKAAKICSQTGYVNACLGAREWENKEGYVNNDLFLPKRNRMGVPLEEVDAENSNLITFDKNDSNHFRAMVKKESAPANNFEPAPTAGSDFEL
tara:strand:+ start:1526 stop:2200 length:675 start_codon:yes stop_codon:yes gene_type:complete